MQSRDHYQRPEHAQALMQLSGSAPLVPQHFSTSLSQHPGSSTQYGITEPCKSEKIHHVPWCGAQNTRPFPLLYCVFITELDKEA